jgi:hypothetical protein
MYITINTSCSEGAAFPTVPNLRVMTGKEFNRRTGDQKKFKCIAADMIHYGFKYEEGIVNILNQSDKQKFPELWDIDYMEGMCSSGLHFTSGNNLYDWILHGPQLYEVSIPNDALVMCDSSKCKATELILEKKIIDRIENNTYSFDELFSCGITDIHFLARYADFSQYTPEQIIDLVHNNRINFGFIPIRYKSTELYEAGIKKGLFKLSDVPSFYVRPRTVFIAIWYNL